MLAGFVEDCDDAGGYGLGPARGCSPAPDAHSRKQTTTSECNFAHASQRRVVLVEMDLLLHEKNGRGVELYRQGRHEEAIAIFEEALSSSGENASTYSNIGAARAALQSWEAAEDAYTRALELDRKPRYLLKRSYVRSQLEKHESALADAEEAGVKDLIEAREQARRCRQALEADRQAAAGPIDDRMVHCKQTLRFVFASEVPRCWQSGERLTVRVRIANEFGLWRRSDWAEVSRKAVATLRIGDDLVEMREGRAEASLVSPGGLFTLRVAVDREEDWIRIPVPVLSLPINDGNNYEGVTCCREFLENKLVLAEAALGIGGKVWDSSYVLLAALQRFDITNQSVLELGSGVGVVGLACAVSHSPRSVCVTDCAEVVPLLDLNIRLNSLQEKCVAVELDWFHCDKALPLLPENIDVLLLSDVVYDPVLYQPLISTMAAICCRSRGGTTSPSLILLAHRHRNPHDAQFFQDLSRHFDVASLPLDNEPATDVKVFQLKTFSPEP